MSANLTPQYYKAEERYKAAPDDRERLAALREMLSVMPKHKGTEKLQADLKKKIAEIRVRSGTKKGVHRAATHMVERSGAAQVVLVGPPNSGKSRFVADLTNADPEVHAFPYTTWTPTPGIVEVNHAPIQVVDVPPVAPEHTEPWLSDLLRNADGLVLLMDAASDEILDHWDLVVAALATVRIRLGPPPREEKRDAGDRWPRHMIVANKMDMEGATDRVAFLSEFVEEKRIHEMSLETSDGVQAMLGALVTMLGLVRVYTKEPQKEVDVGQPFVMKHGSTVEDVARLIHKELAQRLKFVRAWGERFHDGQPVSRDLVLEDGDILEFHE